ncbi:MAG: M18 family aminopeptidase, partial [Ghiorsea sp.]
MKTTELSTGLLDFIQQSPTPFHAVQTMVKMLEKAGFERLKESQAWQMKSKPIQGKYYVTRNDSSLIAFTINQPVVENGIRMVGAHTDSPCLKVKPNPEIFTNQCMQLGVEVYGGVLLNPWFDRDLSLAGRVSFLDDKQQLQHALVNFNRAIAIIPSLAIHLDREANDLHSINKQNDLPPVLMNIDKDESQAVSFAAILLNQIHSEHPNSKALEILDYELSFYDVQPPAFVGLHDDFIASARLDNLLSCYVGLQALLGDTSGKNSLLVCTDHEEVGSASTSGA